MQVSSINPSTSHSNIDETTKYLDALQALAELLSIAAEADAVTDAILSDPKRLRYALDGIGLLAFDAQQRLHEF